MNKDLIFIHIPKTGGTTINSAMQNSAWQTEPDFNYRHIILKSKKSNAGDIFDPQNFEKYKPYTIFMMLRHPVDRVISEYYFIRERKNFMDLLRKKPSNFNSYIKNRQTQNAVVNFLKGKRFFDISSPTESDLDDVLDAIDELNIHCGIFEQFEASLQYFSQIGQLQWNQNIEVKRMTFKRPKVNEIEETTRQLIIENNRLDMELYEYALQRFNKINHSPKVATLNFIKDKYTHVIPYAAGICLFELSVEHKKYIKANLEFFKELTFYLLKNKGIKAGKLFTTIWNDSFLKAIAAHFPNSNFLEALEKGFSKEAESLDMLYVLGANIDAFFKQSTAEKQQYYQGMKFNPGFVVVPETKTQAKPKKGFFGRLFGSK